MPERRRMQHNWTEQELWIVSVCYKENLPVDLALKLTNTTNKKSMEMRYQNCLFLDKGKVENSLSHPSKAHVKVWEEMEEMYRNQPSSPTPEMEEEEEIVPPPPKEEDKEEAKLCEVACGALFVVYLGMLLSFIL